MCALSGQHSTVICGIFVPRLTVFPSVLQVDEDIIEAPIVPHEHAFILNRLWRSQCSSYFCFPLRLGLTC